MAGDENTNGHRYPLRWDGRSILLLVVTAVWAAAHVNEMISAWYNVPDEIDIAMTVLLAGAFGWTAVGGILDKWKGR